MLDLPDDRCEEPEAFEFVLIATEVDAREMNAENFDVAPLERKSHLNQ